MHTTAPIVALMPPNIHSNRRTHHPNRLFRLNYFSCSMDRYKSKRPLLVAQSYINSNDGPAIYMSATTQEDTLFTPSFRFYLAMDTLGVQLYPSHYQAGSGLSPFRASPHNGARRFGEGFWPSRKFWKCGNTLCISHFSYCTDGAFDPPKPAAPIVRCCLRFCPCRAHHKKTGSDGLPDPVADYPTLVIICPSRNVQVPPEAVRNCPLDSVTSRRTASS